MPNTCAKAVHIVRQACVYEYILCTKVSASHKALWVSTRLTHTFTVLCTTSLPTGFLGLSYLFFGGFSPLSTAPITKPYYMKKIIFNRGHKES